MKLNLILILILCNTIAALSQVHFLSNPNISPDGKQIIFSHDNDLWIVPAIGGQALRLTAMDGEESLGAWSPDGKWIAFSSTQSGNNDIYVMPQGGGEIRRITYCASNDLLEGWGWDSETLYFTSDRQNQLSSYSVKVSGGTPRRLFGNYYNMPHNITELPDGSGIYFNTSWESSIFSHRKRYKGDFNPDIRYYNIKTGQYKTLTSFRGQDMWPTVDRNGNLYYVSDSANGEYNLYSLKDGRPAQLTNFGTSIKRPRVSADGSSIVFERDYRLYVYDVNSAASKAVEVSLPDNNTLPIDLEYNVRANITNFDVSPDNKKIAFVSRGVMFVTDIKGEYVKQIDTKADEIVAEIMWTDDSKTLIYTRTENGWLNLFKTPADNSGKETRLTDEEANHYELKFGPDRKKILYFCGRDQLRIFDVESSKSETIVKDEFWAIYSKPAYFSPDSRYVVYSAYRNFERDIFIYDTKTEEIHNISNSVVNETEPYWSPDGKYIYFTADRHTPSYPMHQDDKDLYRIALDKWAPGFKSEIFEKLFAEDKDDEAKEEKDESKEEDSTPEVKINFDGLEDRWERLVSKHSPQNTPYAFDYPDSTVVFYTSAHEDKYAVYMHIIPKIGKQYDKKIAGSSTPYLMLINNGKGIYFLDGGAIKKINIGSAKATKIDIKHKFTKNYQSEFYQMFYDGWANMKENFYDEQLHNMDWDAARQRYRQFLPYVRTRADLRTLLNDLLGELNSSHQRFTSAGREEKLFLKSASVFTGIVFDEDKPYTVADIVPDSPVDYIGAGLKPGDKLLSVNGVKVDEKQNREKYFVFTSRPTEIILGMLGDNGEYNLKLHPNDYNAAKGYNYKKWVRDNQEFVDKQSDNKIAYIHMADMMGASLDRFMIEMTNEAAHKEALILDLRYNHGGNVHDVVLNWLSRKPYTQWRYRGGKMSPQPFLAPSAKPIVLLINEETLSDGEMTAAGFKELGLGTIIGTESYRWLIFTSGKGMVDGSFIRMPAWGCYTLSGEDIETNGVKPDIYINKSFKDKLDGKYPQLGRAVDEIMKQLKK